jgi:hypothetical protein
VEKSLPIIDGNVMDSASLIHPTACSQSRRPAPKEWIEALEQGRADIEAGRTVDAEAFVGRLERDARLFGNDGKQRGAATSHS